MVQREEHDDISGYDKKEQVQERASVCKEKAGIFRRGRESDYSRTSSMHCTVADLAALDASRKADGTAADSLADSLKDRVNKLQAQLDQLQKQKDDTQLLLSAHLKAEVSC